MSDIVVLSGSPRVKGNTSALVAAFKASAESLGHTVKVYDVAANALRGCRACNGCYRSEDRPCVQTDGWNPIAHDIRNADGVVFAFPIYFYGMSGQMKVALDRMYCFHKLGFDTGEKKASLISCVADDSDDAFDGVKATFDHTLAMLGWEDVGDVLLGGVEDSGQLYEGDGIKQAEDLANLY
ncbi:Multimeric flavodoxin WrbA [Thermoplasmatales archaeon BRNA1]|nr:Multimeric flavodoxin WrbA [Thermoplasmatales archaeon BRNA1]